MMRKFILSLSLLISTFITVRAQVNCGTDIEERRLREKYPQIATYEANLETALQNTMKHRDLNRFARTTGVNDTIIYDVPVVVHIIHDYGAEYLPDDSIIAAIPAWTQVYLEQNPDTADVIDPFKPYIGKPLMRFHLATIDPDGNPTKGITRHQSYLASKGDDVAKLDDWPHDKYVNIWVVNAFGGVLTGAAAYAHYPAIGQVFPYSDGVMCLYSYFNIDKTIPHELGHVFNLRHVFGDTNNPGLACGDDYVDDTPPTIGHYSTGCVPSALYDTTCCSNYFKIYQDINGLDSLVDYPDTVNAQNIMDYTYCSRMFTKGQVVRMRMALTDTVANRRNLCSSQNLASTGAMAPLPDLPPVADFSVETASGSPSSNERRSFFLCMNSGTNFVFANRSWNDTITGAQWTFSNGATHPTSTSLTTVANNFSQPGWVTITLAATGNNTGTTTTTRTQAVYVADTTALQPSGFVQDFTSAATTSNWPMFNYYNNQFQWELFNGAGYDDNNCVRYHSYDGRPYPANAVAQAGWDYDDIITPAFNLSGITGALNLNFYTAGSYRLRVDSVYNYPDITQDTSSAASDSMQIYISTTCGASWIPLTKIKNTDLLNNPSQDAEFIPSAPSQWKARTINIPVQYRSSKTFFRFRYMPSINSNNLYFDKFSISPYSTEVNSVANNASAIVIYPNPTHGSCNMAFTTGSDGKVDYEVRDVTGKLIYKAAEVYNAHTMVQKELPAGTFPAAGFYLITVTNANKTSTQKLVVE